MCPLFGHGKLGHYRQAISFAHHFPAGIVSIEPAQDAVVQPIEQLEQSARRDCEFFGLLLGRAGGEIEYLGEAHICLAAGTDGLVDLPGALVHLGLKYFSV